MAVEVVINCRTQREIHPELLASLKKQTEPFHLQILESANFPTRLSNIQDQDSIYVFLDQDVVLPHQDFLRQLKSYVKSNPEKLFLTGAYLSDPSITYLGHCYNSQVNSWILTANVHKESGVCENAPGGIWVVSGKILPYLSGWVEPQFWAGEDTFAARWLQAKGIKLYYTPLADIYHYPKCELAYFLKRAFKQGQARKQHGLVSQKYRMNWKFHLKNSLYWPGWSLHQFFVMVGSIRSLMARTKP